MIYFVRAFVEAPGWVKSLVKVQIEVQEMAKVGPKSRGAARRWIRYCWGTEIPILRDYLRLTLLSWMEHGIPEEVASERGADANAMSIEGYCENFVQLIQHYSQADAGMTGAHM